MRNFPDFPEAPAGWYWVVTKHYDLDEGVDLLDVRLFPLQHPHGRLIYCRMRLPDGIDQRPKRERSGLLTSHAEYGARSCLYTYRKGEMDE